MKIFPVRYVVYFSSLAIAGTNSAIAPQISLKTITDHALFSPAKFNAFFLEKQFLPGRMDRIAASQPNRGMTAEPPYCFHILKILSILAMIGSSRSRCRGSGGL
jgi:hypothetical protein